MIYLIHFEKPLFHARHYLGFCVEDLEARIDRHAKGTGSKLMRAVVKAGIRFAVVRVWEEGDRNFERKLKNRKNTPRLCPICNPKLTDI